VQVCLVHFVRSSLRFVPYKDRRAVAADLKKIYTSVDVDVDAAADELQRFAETWDHRFPTISRSWLEHWERIIPFMAFPAELRRAIYTTNTFERHSRPSPTTTAPPCPTQAALNNRAGASARALCHRRADPPILACRGRGQCPEAGCRRPSRLSQRDHGAPLPVPSGSPA
jgi:mutator family transposase